MPLTEGVVKYHYVVLAKTHRYEARIADRSINIQGLPDGAKVYVQDSFRSPKVKLLCFPPRVSDPTLLSLLLWPHHAFRVQCLERGRLPRLSKRRTQK